MAVYPKNFIGPLPTGSSRGNNLIYPSNFIGPIPTGGVRLPSGGDVLGASTGGSPQSSTPNIQTGNISSNNNGGGQQSISGQDINDLYAPGLQLADEQANQLNGGYGEDVANLESSTANENKKYLAQQDQLLGDTAQEENKFYGTTNTALSDALRSYNALQQQRRARFGFGSSAGEAVGELAQQEFFKQQGQIGQKNAEGALQFAQEKSRIKQFVQGKLDDLDQYKREALTSLKKNLQDGLNAIAARKGDIEANKAKDRMGILQDTINQTRQIAQQDKQFRQQLGLAAVAKMQEIAQRAFTPKEIQAVLSEFGAGLPGLTGGNVVQGGALSYNYNPTTKNQDELTQLNPYSG